VPTDYAQGSRAWDDAGAEYSFSGAFLDLGDAVRALKHGTRLGLLKGWGTADAIVWFSVPVFEGSRALKALNRWFTESVSSLDSPSFTHWLAVAGDRAMILVWDDCGMAE
jgi:hypothetical protein